MCLGLFSNAVGKWRAEVGDGKSKRNDNEDGELNARIRRVMSGAGGSSQESLRRVHRVMSPDSFR